MSKRSDNARRKQNGQRALEAYCATTGADYDSALVDLLTDLRHGFARAHAEAGRDFDTALRISAGHYEAEK